MILIDYIALLGTMAWMLVIGAIFSTRMKSSREMFAAGGRSPWWVAGLSGFMTIFSAGTFVVWGGIAYRLGLVAVSILMLIGVSMIAVGAIIAGRWRRLGIKTPTEFLRIRFNERIVQTYTWLIMLCQSLGLGVGLYSLAVMLSVLVPLPEGFPFRDPATGNLSASWCVIFWGGLVVAYTMAGGLWAVLMTDVIQCLILCLVVLVAVPLSLAAVGGVGEFVDRAPPGFLSLAAQEYTYTFLGLWILLNFFRYATDWAFVQRYICVPTPRDSKKAAYLMGMLYLISPILWMTPVLVYRVLQPNADPEEAYVLICTKVLPAGMLGVMIAAMFSATASMISSLLNVFAGVFVCDFYRLHINPDASERRLVLVGRLATFAYGALVVCIALVIPYIEGKAEEVVLALVSLVTPLFLPIFWGFFSRKINARAVWFTIAISAIAVIIVKLGPMLCDQIASLATCKLLTRAVTLIQENSRMIDAGVGLILPLMILTVAELVSWRKNDDPGWQRVADALASYKQSSIDSPIVASRLPAKIVAASLGLLGLMMTATAIFATTQRGTLAIFAVSLLVVAAAVAWLNREKEIVTKEGN